METEESDVGGRSVPGVADVNRAFVISGARLTYDHASVPVLEAASHADPLERLDELVGRDHVSEAFVLQTCNRVEEYVVTGTADEGQATLSDFPGSDDLAVEMDHVESLRHLLRVAAGLESQVLGEDQILGQVRTSYLDAKDRGSIGPVLDEALLKAIRVGERARTETAINEGIISLGGAAVELAERECGLDGATALVVGAGEMAELVAAALAPRVDELRVANRSLDRAAVLADRLDSPVEYHSIDELSSQLSQADVVVTSTGSREPVIDRSVVGAAGETLIIDIAQPRDVAPDASVRGVRVHDLDGLKSVTEATHRDRREAARQVEAIVDEEFNRLIDQYKRRRADAVIKAMYMGAERIMAQELSQARRKLDLEEEEQEVVEALAESIAARLMAVPTRSLRDAAAGGDWDTISTAIELFDPAIDVELLEGLPTDATEPDTAEAGTSHGE